MTDTELKLRLPSEAKLKGIRKLMVEDEDWKLARIAMDPSKRPRFSLPMPTLDEPDNVEIEKSFRGVILTYRKSSPPLTDEEKEAGKEPVETRALYILREGQWVPDIMYVGSRSKTSLRNWKQFAFDNKLTAKNCCQYLVEFTAEQIKWKAYVWSRPKFAVVRPLTEEELAHIEIMQELVQSQIKEYESTSELDRYEEESLAAGSLKVDAVVKEEDIAKHKRAALDDDEDEAPVVKAKKATSKVEEDEDKVPKPKAKKPVPKDEEDEDEKPAKKSAGRAGYPNLDDDED